MTDEKFARYCRGIARDSRLDYKLKGLILIVSATKGDDSFSVDELVKMWGMTSTRVRTYVDILKRCNYIYVHEKDKKTLRYKLGGYDD